MERLIPCNRRFRWQLQKRRSALRACCLLVVRAAAHRTAVRGDKTDHFESMRDVWEMFRIVLDERKRREIDPTIALLKECVAEASKAKETDKHTEQRLRELHRFFETTTAWYAQVAKLPGSA